MKPSSLLLTLGAAALLLATTPSVSAQTSPPAKKKTTAKAGSRKKKSTAKGSTKTKTKATTTASTKPTPAPAPPPPPAPVVVAPEPAPVQEEVAPAAPGVGAVLLNALIGQLTSYASEKLQLQKRMQSGDASAASGLASLTGKVAAVQSQLTAPTVQASMTPEQTARYNAATTILTAGQPAPAPTPGLPTIKFGK